MANRSREMNLLFCSALVTHMQMLGPGLGHYEHPGVSPMTGHKCDEGTGAPGIEREAEKAGTILPREEKAQGRFINVHKHPMGENKDGVTLFSVISSEGRRGSGHKTK